MDDLFYKSISESTAHRASREFHVALVQNDPNLFADLINIAFDTNGSNHCKACWILELVVEPNIEILTPHLDDFFEVLPSWNHGGAVRSISKICLFLTVAHLKKHKFDQTLFSENQLQQMAEKCFDWLISDTKVASKAYAMRTLFEIGKLQDWIYPELKEILTKDFPHHSAGYKAAAKDVLRKMDRQKTFIR